MGISLSASGTNNEDVYDILKEVFETEDGPDDFDNFEEITISIDGDITLETDGDLTIGNEESGVIIHSEEGETKEGELVEEERWVEIYGREVHFSEME